MKQCVSHILRFKITPYFQSLRGLYCQLLPLLIEHRTFGGYFLIKQTVRMAKQINERTILVRFK